MPGTIRGAVSNGTFPTTLSTKFVRAQSVQVRVNEYHDGTTQRSALVDESRRTWQLAKRLTAADLATLRDFWQANPNTAFTFYDPFETVPPFTQNPTTTDGAYLVRFNSDWNETIGMVRSDAGVELIEMTATPAGTPVTGGGDTNPPADLYLDALIGAFTDGSGNVIQPVFLGNGPTVLTVPDGATQLQMGVNDDTMDDNGGSWIISVSGINYTVSGKATPWLCTGGMNAAYLIGQADFVDPVVAPVTEGAIITVSYVSGTVTDADATNCDADGNILIPYHGTGFLGHPVPAFYTPL